MEANRSGDLFVLADRFSVNPMSDKEIIILTADEI